MLLYCTPAPSIRGSLSVRMRISNGGCRPCRTHRRQQRLLSGERVNHGGVWRGLVPVTEKRLIAVCNIHSGTDKSARQSQSVTMGNKPAKQENKREEILVRVMPPLDRAFIRWLTHDIQRLHSFGPRNPRAIKPPDHYVEYMRLYGWLDLDMDDPDLARLVK